MTESMQRELELYRWAQSLTKEQVAYLFDGGWYNNTVKGYLIAAADNAGLDDEQTDKLMDGLRDALSAMPMRKAEQIYTKR